MAEEGPDGGEVGVNTPSSRSLSNMRMVPSAKDARKSVDDCGTQRTQVQGEEVMQPWGTELASTEHAF